MSFNAAALERIALGLFRYSTDDDASAAGYFASAAHNLKKGDTILVHGSDGTFRGAIGVQAVAQKTSAALGSVTLAGGSLSSSYLGQVATRTIVPNFTTGGGGNKATMARWGSFARDNLTTFQIAIPNWYINTSTGAETASGGTMTLTASIEYPAGVFTQVLFSGVPTGSIPSGNTLISDPITVAIPSGAKFWTRIWATNPAGALALTISQASPGDGVIFAAATTADLTMGGAVTQANTFNFGPCAIIAQTNRPSVFLAGDSRVVGVNDVGDATGDTGLLARSLGGQLAYINAGCGSDYAQRFLSNSVKRRALAAYCSHVVCAYGINDLANAGRTGAQVLADVNSIAALSGLSGKPFYQATLTPYTTSTDSWATTVNQTPNASNAQRIVFNNSLRTGGLSVAGGYFEIADMVESARNSGLWTPGFTTDGLHESQSACLAIQTAGKINPAVFVR